MRHRLVLALSAVTVLAAGRAGLAQDPAAQAGSLRSLPIREVSVFKDGHAFVLREGEMPVGADGNVLVEDLPRPVLGTFWPFASDANAKLASVVAGKRRVAVERTALAVPDLLRANVGAEATFTEINGSKWAGKILGFPERTSAEIEATSAPGVRDPLPQPGAVMLVQTEEGTRAVAIEKIESVAFKGACRTTVRTEENRDLLTLRLGWKGAPAPTARVGMVYLQKGLRWIPEYRIDIDGAGKAHVRLEATLVNDLADLDRAAVHLVVGVPKFDFKDLVDPMALASDLAETVAGVRNEWRFANFASNSIQTQLASSNDYVPSAGTHGSADVGDAVGGAAANEDLFVFDLKDVTLRRGERMTLPVAEYDIPYTDVYTVDVPLTPPPEIWQSGRGAADLEKMRALVRPVAMHKIRLDNAAPFPLTTAPAVVLRDGRLLGQGSTSYTPVCGRCDVSVTQAIGLRVKNDEEETGRTPDSVRWRNESFHRVDLGGSIRLSNDTDRAYDVEVTRHVLGTVDSAGQGGTTAMINMAEDMAFAGTGSYPAWWGWFNWPYWWHRMNGAGRITWSVTIEPKKTATLDYKWHYLWQ